jgi:TrpR-related protein YerC/YecD
MINHVLFDSKESSMLDQTSMDDLCDAFLTLDTRQETYLFLKDLCTPAELNALAERWKICQLLDQGLSYREVQLQTQASLSTIGRVARFLKEESYHGYTQVLNKQKASN